MYTHKTQVRMHDTDAAGVIFFAHQFRIAHVAFEHFLDTVGLGLGATLAHKNYRVPIVHADADYRMPLRLGDELTIELKAEKIGRTSFTLTHRILVDGGREAGSVRTIHVTVDAATWQKRELPSELRAAIEKHLG